MTTPPHTETVPARMRLKREQPLETPVKYKDLTGAVDHAQPKWLRT